MASDRHGDELAREPRDGESRDGAGHIRPVPPGVPNAPESDAVERLKVTSPRLEQDEFTLTPCGRPDRPDARRLNQTSSTRAVYEPTVGLDDSEQATLGEGDPDDGK